MPTNIDETELARLEDLAKEATSRPWRGDGHKECGYGWVKIPGFNTTGTERSAMLGQYLGADDDARYIAAACNAVPALVAEVRRLRAEVKQGSADYCALMDRHDAQFVRAEKLREEVNWLAKMCATHCRDKSFDNAQCSIQDCAPLHCYHASAEQWKEAAREAVHADRE